MKLSAAFPAVSISPNTSGLPGLNELSNIVGAMLTVGAILCVLGVILSSAVWAVASTSGNVQLVSRAKTGTVVCGDRRVAHRRGQRSHHFLRERRQRPLMAFTVYDWLFGAAVFVATFVADVALAGHPS